MSAIKLPFYIVFVQLLLLQRQYFMKLNDLGQFLSSNMSKMSKSKYAQAIILFCIQYTIFLFINGIDSVNQLS